MFKYIASAIAATALSVGTFVVPTFATPAHAQTGTITCEARSDFAQGLGIAYNSPTACQRALYECAVRTPYGYQCFVTRWWYS